MTTPTSSAALKASLSMIFTSALVVGAMASPALAAPKEKSNGRAAKPAGGGKAKAPSTVVTEDNDNDGVANNVVDAGDNRHPSGKDRSVEHGGSVNQGKSGSDPDKKTNGGLDKPGGSGGADRHDQDGNNGCGNDDDFEDDNNGNCGGKGRGRVLPKATTPKATTPKANSTVLSGNGNSPFGQQQHSPFRSWPLGADHRGDHDGGHASPERVGSAPRAPRQPQRPRRRSGPLGGPRRAPRSASLVDDGPFGVNPAHLLGLPAPHRHRDRRAGPAGPDVAWSRRHHGGHEPPPFGGHHHWLRTATIKRSGGLLAPAPLVRAHPGMGAFASGQCRYWSRSR